MVHIPTLITQSSLFFLAYLRNAPTIPAHHPMMNKYFVLLELGIHMLPLLHAGENEGYLGTDR